LGMGNLEEALKIRDLAKQHNELFRDSLPLIASENVMSPLAKEMLLTDLGHRYAEGLPHHRYYQGNYFVDLIEDFVIEKCRTLFRCRQVDPRPISGTNANAATIYGLLNPGDPILTPSLSGGGHISAAKFGSVGIRGLNLDTFPFDPETMSVDPDQAIRKIREFKPKVCLLGQSVFLFPAPVKEISEAAREIGAKVWYDGAHVLGLIAGGRFQDPLREGAELITGSTHKTFPGPQHGIILGETDQETWKAVQRGVFPGTISNHHLNAMAALGVTAVEELEFGSKYASDIIDNAKTMAQELHSLGFNVLGEARGFTESHTLVADVRSFGGGKKVAETLEKAGIILNKNMLPWDDSRNSQNPSGIRIGVQEITRIGFSKGEVKHVAELIRKAVSPDADLGSIRNAVKELKEQHRKTLYCFNGDDPYRYIELYG